MARKDMMGQDLPMEDPMDLPEMIVEHSLAPVDGANAPRANGSIPGQEDIFVSHSQGSPNLAMVLLTGSIKPEEYLVRGRVSLKELQDIQEMIAIENTVTTGRIDLMGLIGWRFNASAGVGGAARAEAVRVGTAISKMAMMRSRFGGMFNRFKGNMSDNV